MEASVAAGAADGAAPAAAEGTQDTNGGLDLGPVLERFDGLGSRMEAMEQRIAASFADDGAEEPADDDFVFDTDSLFGDPPESGQGALNTEALQSLVTQATQAQLDRALAPLLERQQRVEVGLEAERLAARYPELGTTEGAKPVVDAAQRLAEAMGHPELVNNMEFIEVIYQSQMAQKYAAGERPVGGEQAFELERAGGAGPAQADEPNIADRIIAGRQKTQFWNQW